MRKLKLDELQACLWHLQNVSILTNGTELNELSKKTNRIAETLNDLLFTRIEMAKEIQQTMKKHDERSQNDE